jgi:hypothetical protein
MRPRAARSEAQGGGQNSRINKLRPETPFRAGRVLSGPEAQAHQIRRAAA